MRYQICIAGSLTGNKTDALKESALACGEAVARAGATVVTGATIGLPHYAALGAKRVEGSLVIGFSPAVSRREHVETYGLPADAYDMVQFTGMEYVGRDIHLVRSADAVIVIGGRTGTLHELTTALEGRKVCGVLLGSGGVADQAKTLLAALDASGARDVLYDTKIERLVQKVTDALDQKYRDMAQS